ncbi:MAG: thiamine diphosphokinase [Oscillospiraceae bacterium]|jgi:thiamine pyrophosphokinase|nr:thiamine diphosphokinase [Oscillospiraceae bacterium]
MAVCYIAGAAPEAVRIRPRPGDFLIAADGGWDRLARWGLRADMVIGDMDSLGAAPEGVPCKRFPREKDATDLSLAMEEAIARGFAHIVVTGAWGGRPDHAMGNLQLLAKAARGGCFARLLCGEYVAAAIAGGGAMRLAGRGTVSVFAYGGEARGVTIRGLEYPLENAALQDDAPLGVSNTLDGEGEITLEHGTLLVFYQEGILCDIA